MKSKDKIKIKKNFAILAFIISILIIIELYNKYFYKNDLYAKETSEEASNIKISTAEPINIENIIEKNTENKGKEEYKTEEVTLEYITKYRNNAQLPKGTVQVVQEGREGKQQIVTKYTYKNEEIVSEEQISCKVTKSAINKIVEIGTGNYKNNYKVKVGDKLYVTSDRLSIMSEPNENSQKVGTIFQKNEVTLTEIQNSWYKIKKDDITGYIKSECVTYMNPNSKYEENENENATNKNNITKLEFNMVLNKPSGLTLEQFKKVLTDSKDENKIFEQNSQYFYYIEKQYNINGIFVASMGIHESAWGTSKISTEKNNLFGYGAYDSNPYNGAYNFSSYAESIDLIARVLVKYYINPKGTGIYSGEKALGTYYNGSTLNAVNKKYATDKNWANAVYEYMKYLYNKL